MSNEPIVTLVGNLTADPELRFTPSGAAVANFTVAQTPRVKDGDDWKDGTPIFVRCTVWREYAENVAESLLKGQRVIAYGRLSMQEYQTREGENRQQLVMDVDEVGHSLRFGSASFTRGARGGGAPQTQQRPRQSSRPQNAPADPWGTPDDPAPF